MRTKQSSSTILVGTARPAREILRVIYVNPADVEAVKAIPEGYAQETRLTRGQAVSLIGKMERRGLVPKGEFRVRLFREGEQRKVAISHEQHSQQAAPTVTSKLPTPEDAARFIQTQPEFRHDLNQVAQQFLGRSISSRADGGVYYAMRHVAILARQLIESTQGGKFTEENVGHRKFYRWSK